MSDDRKAKGIVDPWRMVEPLQKPKKPAVEKKDLEDIDLDADLAIPGRYVIRSAHASFDIQHVRVETPRDALDLLAECVLEVATTHRASVIAAGIGVRTRKGSFNLPAATEQASSLEGDRATIFFIGKPLDKGMLALARILRAPSAATTNRKWGVTPMLTA